MLPSCCTELYLVSVEWRGRGSRRPRKSSTRSTASSLAKNGSQSQPRWPVDVDDSQSTKKEKRNQQKKSEHQDGRLPLPLPTLTSIEVLDRNRFCSSSDAISEFLTEMALDLHIFHVDSRNRGADQVRSDSNRVFYECCRWFVGEFDSLRRFYRVLLGLQFRSTWLIGLTGFIATRLSRSVF